MDRKGSLRARFVSAATSLAVLDCAAFKIVINPRPVMYPGTFWRHAAFLVGQAIYMNFVQLGIAYPSVVFKVVRYHVDFAALSAAVGIALLIFFYLLGHLRDQPERLCQIAWNKVFAVGIVIFALGYAIFLTTDQVGFHKTGVDNRTSIAAALGVALCFLTAAGYFSTKMPAGRRTFCFSLLVSVLCASGALVNVTLARYWILGYQEERNVMQHIAAHHLSLPAGTAFLVDRVCPYVGPASLLESWWENSGVAQLIFHRPDVIRDAISPRIRLHRGSVSISLYGEEKTYPYGDRFVLYNAVLVRVFIIHNSAEMAHYLQTNSQR